MTNKEIQQLINKYLEGETSLEEELQLALELQRDDMPEEWQAIRLMLGELTMGEAEYDAIMEQRKQEQKKPSAILVALRAITSIAAIYLVGLFFWLQQTPEIKTETAYNQSKPTAKTSYCTEGTPREILMCYLEHRQAQPDTYKQLKRMNYEDQ
ncbi:MAG: hypothetical protein J6T05_00815 [Prevotella sp.]|nr:hypothetical protein [Prevotella sp.]